MDLVERNYTLLTMDLLERTEYIKNSVKNSMTVGDTWIIKGITIFEDVIKELNFNEIKEDTIDELNNIITNVLNNKKNTNNYVYFGIQRCFMMLHYYCKSSSFSPKKDRKLKIG